MKRIASINVLLLLLLLLGHCNQASEPNFDDPTLAPTSIRQLKALAEGSTTRIRQELLIEGIVTANDHYGEWERQIHLEDGTSGITLALSEADCYHRYPIGASVRIACNGLLLYNYNGSLLLGTEPDAYARIGLTAKQEAAHLRRTDEHPTTPTPLLITLPITDTRAADRFVRLDGIHFSASGTWCERDPETNRHIHTTHLLIDEQGETLPLWTHASAHYANEPLPEGKGSLYGILETSYEGYRLRVTDRHIYF